MEAGNQINVTISDLAFGGDGVARTDEGVIFVPGTAVGDQVMINVTSVHKSFARGEVVAVLTPGAGRCEPRCPLYGECAGCQYQHIDYATEFAAKQKQLIDLLTRVGHLENLPPLDKAFPSPAEYGYRNKIRLEAAIQDGGVEYGYYLKDNRTLKRIRTCPLASDEINAQIPKALRSDWGKANSAKRPDKRHSRKPGDRRPAGGPGALTLRADTRGTAAFYFGFAPKCITWLRETLNDFEYAVPAGAFWQINPPVAQELVKTVADWFRPLQLDSFIDAYAGVGTFSCAMKGMFVEHLLIESDPSAAPAAENNTQRCGIGAQILTGTTEKCLPKALPRYSSDKTAVLLDPPRTGCQQVVIDTLRKNRPAAVAYVSCNPATLARDLKLLTAGNIYKVEKLALFDMFPRTAHFETAVLLTRS
ncbi:MAG: class I SAM-dependent RNA methyltransferase [Victivallales bacterium]|nr:class I SAM-dependent RNA methyltransferase [Victivallales bacterium]